MNRSDLMPPAGQQVVYRVFGQYGELLYVGVTRNFPQRIKRHRDKSKWWREWFDISFEPFATRAEAEAAEARAIDTENPRWNVARGVPFVDEVAQIIASPRYDDLREMVD